MSDNDDRFIGGPESMSFNFTPAEQLAAKKRREQFDAEVLKELNGNTKPTEQEEWDAVQTVLNRWFPETAAKDAERKKKKEQFEAEIQLELKGNTNPTEEEREAARRRVIDRWYPERVARYKARLALYPEEL